MDNLYILIQQDPEEALRLLEQDPTVSFWVKGAIPALSRRDVVDVLKDLDLLLNCFEARFDTLIDQTPHPTCRLHPLSPESCQDTECDDALPGEDQYPGHLLIGGEVPEALIPTLIQTLAAASVCLGWDEPFFIPGCEEDLYHALDHGNHLHFYNAHALAGSFPFVEATLIAHQIAFDRYSDAHGVTNGELIQYRPGMPRPVRHPVDAQQRPVIDRQLVAATLQRLNIDTLEEVRAALTQIIGPLIAPLAPFRILRSPLSPRPGS